MKKNFLLMAVAAGLTLSAGAQQKVQKYFRVSDAAFNVKNFQDDSNPNSFDASKNSFTVPTSFGSVAWCYGNWWASDGTLDISGYDKLVIRLASVVGNNMQFRIFAWNADGNTMEYDMPDDIVEFDEEIEYEVDLTEDLYCSNEAHKDEPLDKAHVLSFVFWNYWNTNEIKDDEGNKISDDGDPSVTVTISAMYLERTLANGEKDYLDLMANNKFSFSDDFLDTDDDESTSASYMDNSGILHMNENATTGIYFEDEPADWSGYKYLVVVPQAPADDALPVVDYSITDTNDNVFSGGRFRYGVWNKSRAAVVDLTSILTTPIGDSSDDAPEYLEEFDTKSIFSLGYSLWGGVNTWEYGVAGVYLSNTAPTYSSGFGTGTDDTGDYVLANGAANTISTICLPFATACCGAQVYEIAGTDSKTNPTEIYAKPHVGILEAGVPYILRSNCARNITFFQAGCNEVAKPVQNGGLKADAFQSYSIGYNNNYCVLNADGDTFTAYNNDEDVDELIPSNGAYLDFNSLSECEEQENGLVFSVAGIDSSLGISNVTADRNTLKDNKYYDLTGRMVPQPAKKGVYIHNGKKVILK